MVAAGQVEKATERQVMFLHKLLGSKVVRPEIRQRIEVMLQLGLAKSQASIFIDGLLRCEDQPNAPVLPPAPPVHPPAVHPGPKGDHWPKVQEGRYAIVDPADGVLKFYQVDKPKEGRWEGFTFLSVLASDERHPVKAFESKKRILDAIALDPRAALERYGRELGSCGVCGRTLTDALSRKIGIGPVCRGKLGYTKEEELEHKHEMEDLTAPEAPVRVPSPAPFAGRLSFEAMGDLGLDGFPEALTLVFRGHAAVTYVRGLSERDRENELVSWTYHGQKGEELVLFND